MKNVEEVQPYHFPVSLFDELLTSHKLIILSFIFKSNLFCFVANNWGFFKILQLVPTGT
jgi:hypothetical protein